MSRRKVVLRDERSGADSRNLWAWVDRAGALHIDGQDLGPATSSVSDDGEYEWFSVIAAVDVPRVVELLGGGPGDHVLDVLERRWTGRQSYALEEMLRNSEISIGRTTWSG